MDEPRSMTVAEAAQILGLSEQQVYRRITRGDIQATRVTSRNPHYVIAADEVERYSSAGQDLTAPKPNPFWLTTGEAARLTGISQPEIRRMCKAGELVCRTTESGTHYKVSRQALKRLS